jgi:mRNA interferase RelE/StbE
VVKYSLEIKQSAQKELDARDDTVFKRIDHKILALAHNPRPAGCKKLKGFKDQWRIRVGETVGTGNPLMAGTPGQ